MFPVCPAAKARVRAPGDECRRVTLTGSALPLHGSDCKHGPLKLQPAFCGAAMLEPAVERYFFTPCQTLKTTAFSRN